MNKINLLEMYNEILLESKEPPKDKSKNKDNPKNKTVFLGGTWNNSTWRGELIKNLKIDYFNPVVKDWTEEAQKEEIKQRKSCDFCLYVITPKMTGVYSIAEVIDDSNKRPDKTIFCTLSKDGKKEFNEHQEKSLKQVGEMVKKNGGKYFTSLEEVSKHLNKK
jgi:hypothetical protein